MSKITKSTIADVQRLLDDVKQRAATDPSLEAELAKKLGAAAELLSEKDSVTKDLNQAFKHGKNRWSNNVMDGNLEGCNADNKLEKIKFHVLRSSSYSRHYNNENTRPKVERWLQEKFATVGSDQ